MNFRMRREALGIALLAAGLACAPASGAAINPQDYAYESLLLVDGNAALYKATVCEDVYRHTARADLSDLRVINGLNEEIPFAIRRPVERQAEPAAFDPLPLFPLRGPDRAPSEALRFRLRASGASIDLEQPSDKSSAAVTAYLLDVRGSDLPVAALRLTWGPDAPDFSNRLLVESSEDLSHWRIVEQGLPVFNLHYAGQAFVRLDVKLHAQKTSFLRLSWMDAAAPESGLTAVFGQRQANGIEPARQRVTVTGSLSSGGDYEFDLGAHVPVDRLNLELPEPNTVIEAQFLARSDQSKPWESVGSGRLYRLKAAGSEELTNTPLSVATASVRHWRVHVTTAGGLGSGLPTLEAAWVPDELIFLARGPAPFHVLYGNASAAAAGPAQGSLDTSDLRTREGPLEPHSAAVGPAKTLGGDSRLDARTASIDLKRTLLWSVLIVGVAALGTMAWKLARSL
jgi:hypothetical protein